MDVGRRVTSNDPGCSGVHLKSGHLADEQMPPSVVWLMAHEFGLAVRLPVARTPSTASSHPRAVRAVLVDHLTAAVARRELRADTDVELCGAMIHDLYLADFRQAIFGRWNLAALEAQMRSQVSVLLDGLRPLAA